MLSIIIPAYNEEKHLPVILRCIRAQSYKNYEVIVADAGSSDSTRKVAKRFGCKVIKGGMPAVGRNNGAKAAKGDILLFLDADAHIGENFIRDSIDEIKRRRLDIAGCIIIPLGKHPVDHIFFAVFNFWVFSTQFFYPNAAGCSIFCKKKLHKKVNGFDETIKLSEDMDYAKRCSGHGRFRILISVKTHVSMRRFEKEGRVKVGFKLLMSAIYRILFSEIRSDAFKYNLRYRK